MTCKGFAKYTIIFFNFVIVIAAIAIIAIAALAAKNDYTGTTKQVTYFAIVIGAVIFFIAFLGCCGAIKENSCMLTTFAVILIIIFILELVVGILALVAIKQDGKDLQKDIEDSLRDIMVNDTKTMDSIQKTFECCGVDGPSEYGIHVPSSCFSDNKDLYLEGCGEQLKKYFVDILKAVGGVAIFFAVIEVLGASFACYVRNRIGDY